MAHWIDTINWKKAVEDLLKAEAMKAEVDKACKDNQVFYAPHENRGDVKGAWPYLISKTARIDVTGEIEIGPYFMMNDGAVILRHKHPFYKELPMMLQCLARTDPTPKLVIEADVWMQRNSSIMPSVAHVHEGTLLAVGAILTKNTTSPMGIYAGTPARRIKERVSYEADEG